MTMIYYQSSLLIVASRSGVYYLGKWREERYDGWKGFYAALPPEYTQYVEAASFERFCTYSPTVFVEPIEYVLFIKSLYGSLENFFKTYNLI